MTAINKTRDQITETLDNYWQLGLRRILAIRGDYPIDTPKTSQSGDLRYAVDLIKIIKSRHDFDVTAAAYPEIHPETADASKALDYLKAKVDAGASQLITQFFIDPDVFLSFRDAVADAGITAPLVPGIIPIVNFAKVTAFAQKCGTTIPQFLHDMFAGINSGTLDHKLLAMNILSHQITRLHDEDVRRFHLFTLNELTLTQHICHWIRAAL